MLINVFSIGLSKSNSERQCKFFCLESQPSEKEGKVMLCHRQTVDALLNEILICNLRKHRIRA